MLDFGMDIQRPRRPEERTVAGGEFRHRKDQQAVGDQFPVGENRIPVDTETTNAALSWMQSTRTVPGVSIESQARMQGRRSPRRLAAVNIAGPPPGGPASHHLTTLHPREVLASYS
jgi:hypothetical protein